jgi:branched-chain amino acid transport system substrate-binding protein
MAAGYDGEITSVSQCITDATREALPGGDLEGISVISSIALGATEDPSYQLYEAVMATYGDDVEDVENIYAMGAYSVTSALATSVEGISGDIPPESVTQRPRPCPSRSCRAVVGSRSVAAVRPWPACRPCARTSGSAPRSTPRASRPVTRSRTPRTSSSARARRGGSQQSSVR